MIRITEKVLDELLKDVPDIGFYSKDENPRLYLEFKTPMATGWSWYVSEYNPKTKIFYGYVKDFENEWKEFAMQDISYSGCYINPEFKETTFYELFGENVDE